MPEVSDLFPQGVVPYLVGGLLIGAGVAFVYLMTGHIAGLSSFLSAAQSWWSRRAFFRSAAMLAERRWKTVLVVGLILGAAVHTLIAGQAWVTDVAWWRLLVGGVLVGVGTRVGRGCTSGHGICGMSALAPPSILATIVFMAVAIATAKLIAMTGVTP